MTVGVKTDEKGDKATVIVAVWSDDTRVYFEPYVFEPRKQIFN